MRDNDCLLQAALKRAKRGRRRNKTETPTRFFQALERPRNCYGGVRQKGMEWPVCLLRIARKPAAVFLSDACPNAPAAAGCAARFMEPNPGRRVAALCRLSREPYFTVCRGLFACAQGLFARCDAFRRALAATLVSAILPSSYPAPACFVTTNNKARRARPPALRD